MPTSGSGSLSEADRNRYARQLLIPGWGEDGQALLKRSSVFIAGAGGLGSPLALYLAVAGVGRLRLCDGDVVELTNLNRQILHDDSRIGLQKAVSAQRTLRRTNPSVQVEALATEIAEENVDQLVGDSRIIVDCLDNFPTRYVLNRCAVRKHIPLVHAGIRGWDGNLTFLHPPETPCLACIFPEAPPKETIPVLGATPGVLGALQALEVIKHLLGVGSPLKGRLLIVSGLDMEFRAVEVAKDPACAVCARPKA